MGMESEKTAVSPQYRHELKHRITPGQMAELSQRLGVLMRPDPHARADGTYLIRSLYFDSDNDIALREKVTGVMYREKYRIRFYNQDTSFIRLEKKIKHNRLCRKESAAITKEMCQALLSGERDFLLASEAPLLRELYIRMKLNGLRPKTVVDYERRTFYHPMGNTRVTLDYHIRTGIRAVDFLNVSLPTVGVDAVEEDPVCILEVKYDAFLPDFIRDAVQLDDCRQTAYSKYEASRRFG